MEINRETETFDLINVAGLVMKSEMDASTSTLQYIMTIDFLHLSNSPFFLKIFFIAIAYNGLGVN